MVNISRRQSVQLAMVTGLGATVLGAHLPARAQNLPGSGQVSVAFEGKGASIFVGQYSGTATLSNLPERLVVRNDSDVTLRAGTQILVTSRGLDSAGLLTGARQPLQLARVTGDQGRAVTIHQRSDASVLILSRPLATGQSLVLGVSFSLAAGVAAQQLGSVQLLAKVQLRPGVGLYREAQSPEHLVVSK